MGNRSVSRRALLAAGLLSSAAVAFFVLTRFRVLSPSYAHPPSELRALEAFPYDDWEAVLQESVDEHGNVDYAGLAAAPQTLERFVALLRDVGPRQRPELFAGEADRLAYYLNAYNALVLYDVLDHWPLRSPRDIRLRFFYTTRFVVDGAKTNLYELENHVIRGTFDEPRIHFALNCASIGCPRLPRTAFRPERLEEQLRELTLEFLAASRNVRVEDDAVVLSELFDWYAVDFPPDPVSWIRAHGTGPAAELPLDRPVRYAPWDWSINAQGPVPETPPR